jgi:NADPH-dependent 2,4-dienoyl-CoA reductase/sulfur reductase-like enzyme
LNGTKDPASVAGKGPPVPDEADLLIVGAGSAGLAAALAAAGKGVRVVLVEALEEDWRAMQGWLALDPILGRTVRL